MVWKVVKSAQPPVRYRPNSDRRPDIVRCGVPYIPTFPYDDSDSRRWFLCDSATCLLVAGVDTLGGREGENPRRAVRRSARSARRARSYRLAKLVRTRFESRRYIFRPISKCDHPSKK